MDEKTHRVVNENFNGICDLISNRIEKKYQELKKCRQRTLTEFILHLKDICV